MVLEAQPLNSRVFSGRNPVLVHLELLLLQLELRRGARHLRYLAKPRASSNNPPRPRHCLAKPRLSNNPTSPLYSDRLSNQPTLLKRKEELPPNQPSLLSSTVCWSVVRSAHYLQLRKMETLKISPACNSAWMIFGERQGSWVLLETRMPSRPRAKRKLIRHSTLTTETHLTNC